MSWMRASQRPDATGCFSGFKIGQPAKCAWCLLVRFLSYNRWVIASLQINVVVKLTFLVSQITLAIRASSAVGLLYAH